MLNSEPWGWDPQLAILVIHRFESFFVCRIILSLCLIRHSSSRSFAHSTGPIVLGVGKCKGIIVEAPHEALVLWKDTSLLLLVTISCGRKRLPCSCPSWRCWSLVLTWYLILMRDSSFYYFFIIVIEGEHILAWLRLLFGSLLWWQRLWRFSTIAFGCGMAFCIRLLLGIEKVLCAIAAIIVWLLRRFIFCNCVFDVDHFLALVIVKIFLFLLDMVLLLYIIFIRLFDKIFILETDFIC